MSDDIVTLMLREYEYMNAGRGGDYEMLLRGAQEIERLRWYGNRLHAILSWDAKWWNLRERKNRRLACKLTLIEWEQIRGY